MAAIRQGLQQQTRLRFLRQGVITADDAGGPQIQRLGQRIGMGAQRDRKIQERGREAGAPFTGFGAEGDLGVCHESNGGILADLLTISSRAAKPRGDAPLGRSPASPLCAKRIQRGRWL